MAADGVSVADHGLDVGAEAFQLQVITARRDEHVVRA